MVVAQEVSEEQEQEEDGEKVKTFCTAFPFFSVVKLLMKADLYLLVCNMLHVCYTYVRLQLCCCVPTYTYIHWLRRRHGP